jgi:hypothetical protein
MQTQITTKSEIEFSEHEHQVKVFEWLDSNKLKAFAVPNGYYKGFAAQRKAKDEGLRSGIPDILILNPNKKTGKPVALELKRIKAKNHKICNCLSPEQLEWKEIFMQHGWTHIIAHGYTDAITALIELYVE